MKQLFKTTIVIWSEWDPTKVELSYLATEAETGNAYCSVSKSVTVADPQADPDWDGTEFFDKGESE